MKIDRLRGAEHKRAFVSWIDLTLEEQAAALTSFLENQSLEARKLTTAWLDSGAYEELIPLGTWNGERELFLSDMNLVLLITNKKLKQSAR